MLEVSVDANSGYPTGNDGGGIRVTTDGKEI